MVGMIQDQIFPNLIRMPIYGVMIKNFQEIAYIITETKVMEKLLTT